MFGAEDELSWEQLGDYAKYLQGFYKETANISKNANYQDDKEIMLDFMAAYDNNIAINDADIENKDLK